MTQATPDESQQKDIDFLLIVGAARLGIELQCKLGEISDHHIKNSVQDIVIQIFDPGILNN